MHFLGEAKIMEGIKLHHEICVRPLKNCRHFEKGLQLSFDAMPRLMLKNGLSINGPEPGHLMQRFRSL